MRVHRTVAYSAILLMLFMLLPIYSANAQDYMEYNIKINSDNSATWQIIKVTDINAPIDTWENFQSKVFGILDSAAATTNRPMSIDESSLQINTTISASSKTTEYMFIWQNFSSAQDGDLAFGDVFQAGGFFTQLYGEASIQISYPQNLIVKTVTPYPDRRDNGACTLKWYRTQDLENSRTLITLTENPNPGSTPQNDGIPLQTIVIATVSTAAAAIVLTATFFVTKHRKQQPKTESNSNIPVLQIEKEEDKILNILRASKTGVRQSDISEQCRFSKAKTSQLLAALEKRAIITRYKSGRDKIVTLNERGKGEKT